MKSSSIAARSFAGRRVGTKSRLVSVASSKTVSRVMPSRQPASGVSSLPALTANRLKPGPSVTLPSGSVRTTFIFPEWFVCAQEPEPAADGRRRRRIVKWSQLSADRRGHRFFEHDGQKLDVTPIRFVGGCKKGHIQDLNWHQLLHGPAPCAEAMWLEEKGTSAAPTDTIISCDCGRSVPLDHVFAEGRLGRCGGRRPWLRTYENQQPHEQCSNNLRFLTRTATNTYFPQVASVISLPEGQNELEKTLARAEIAEALKHVEVAAEIGQARKFNPKVKDALESWSDEEVFAALKRPRNDAGEARGFRELEFDLLASGDDEIGSSAPQSRLYARTLSRPQWENEPGSSLCGMVKKLVAVHRLREVSCIYGFTRFEAPRAPIDDGLEDIRLTVEGAPLGLTRSWLPAIEQLGEGIFIQLDEAQIASWLANGSVVAREHRLKHGFNQWKRKNPSFQGEFPGLAYVMVHSLSHALMSEIALECGYPASSLKERIYALRNPADHLMFNRLGILIYTASTGAQGTLGGIVSVCERFATLLRQAIDRIGICSNDPICSDHDPGGSDDDCRLIGAACHGCLLVAETSCENRNQYLDRAALVSTLAKSRCGFAA
ncbi:MAG: DUF1998 domain-containing protein [Alphaproteobacteria bacterium]|nr:DUF1998 domain-containing protein [Alphaproteobacteria bacterium]